MSRARSRYPTMQEILSEVPEKARSKRSVVEGMTPRSIPHREGEILLTPEQLLSVRIPYHHVQGNQVHGYQRVRTVSKMRALALWILDHADNYLKLLPIPEYSITDNIVVATDGQHRTGGAIIARKPLRARLVKRSETEARTLFALQGKAKLPSRNLLIFDGEGPFDEYIQDAVTDSSHPWHHLISASQHSGGSNTRMSAAAAHKMLRIFVAKSASNAPVANPTQESRFDRMAADDLATLFSAFGTKSVNSAAHTAKALSAIAQAARWVFRERVPHPDDRDRWIRHMPRFPFHHHGHLTSAELAEKLRRHWNVRVSDDRKI